MTPDSVIVSKLRELTSMIAAATIEARLKMLANTFKYDPDQPRVPAGGPEGGRWTTSEGGEIDVDDALASFTLAARRGRSAAYCAAQYAIDGLLCRTVESASRRRACWEQAAFRLGDCISGRPLRPLNF